MSPARILIIEDEESIRFVLTRSLEGAGHRVESHSDGRAGLRALKTGEWDLAILDIRLPDVSGLDLLSEARDVGLETPVLVMTAESTMANAIEAMEAWGLRLRHQTLRRRRDEAPRRSCARNLGA